VSPEERAARKKELQPLMEKYGLGHMADDGTDIPRCTE